MQVGKIHSKAGFVHSLQASANSWWCERVLCDTDECWVAMYHAGANGGHRHNSVSASGSAGCQAACVNNPLCTGVDFYTSSSTCYLHGPWSGYHVHFMSGVVHYDYTCRGRGSHYVFERRDRQISIACSTCFVMITQNLFWLFAILGLWLIQHEINCQKFWCNVLWAYAKNSSLFSPSFLGNRL